MIFPSDLAPPRPASMAPSHSALWTQRAINILQLLSQNSFPRLPTLPERSSVASFRPWLRGVSSSDSFKLEHFLEQLRRRLAALFSPFLRVPSDRQQVFHPRDGSRSVR